MPEQDDEQTNREAAVRRSAQDTAGELARMGIDPGSFGLEAPATDPAGPPEDPVTTPTRRTGPVGPGRSDLGPSAGLRMPPGVQPTGRGVATIRSVLAAQPAPPRAAPIGFPPRPPAPISPGVGHQFGPHVPPGANPPGPPGPPGQAPPGQPMPVSGAGGPPPGPYPPTMNPGALPPGAPPGPVTGQPPALPGPPGPPGVLAAPGAPGTPGAPSALNRPLDPAAGSSQLATPAGSPIWAVDSLIASPPAPVLSAGWRRLLRGITLGLVQPGAAAAIQRERELTGRARAHQREHRGIVFLSGKGGVGTTTTAVGVAMTLASVRQDQVALVDTRPGTGSLGRRMARRPAPTLSELVAATEDVIMPQPLALSNGLRIVDGAPWHSPVDRGDLFHVLDEFRETYPFTLLDVGNETGDAAHGALGRADQIVIVTAGDENAIESTRVALGRVYQLDPAKVITTAVAVVCLSRRSYRKVARKLRNDLGLGDNRLVPVPFDPALAGGDEFNVARLRTATREAYLSIAAVIADASYAAAPRRLGQPAGRS